MKPQIYILKNTHLEVHISTLGATLTRMLTKDLQGKVVDVLLGMERPKITNRRNILLAELIWER